MQMLLSEGALKIYNKALELNRRYFLKHSYTVGSDNIFLAFIESGHPLAKHFLDHFGLQPAVLVREICKAILPMSAEAVEQNARAYFEEVNRQMMSHKARITSEWDLFAAVFEMVTSATVVMLLRDGFNYNDLKNYLWSAEIQTVAAGYRVDESGLLPQPELHPPPLPPEARVPLKPKERLPAPAVSLIDQLGTDLTRQALDGQLAPAHYREEAIRQMMEILCRSTERNVVLVGEPGVGKTAAVQGLAWALASPDCPERLKERTVVKFHLSALLPGSKMRGSLEEKVAVLIEESKKRRNALFFFEEFGGVIENKDLEPVVQLLQPALAAGDVQCIVTLQPERFRQDFEPNRPLSRCFSPIHLQPPTADQAVEILARLAPRVEQYHKVKITEDAIRASVEFTEAYLKSKVLPGKAIAALDSAAARVSLASHVGNTVHREDVAEVVSREVKIPASRILATRVQSIAKLEEFLKSRVIGQDPAIRAVVDTIQINRSGLGLRAQRPDGVFLLVGPTGVGKTELAKCVSEGLTANPNKLLRFDMSEFSEKHTVAKLIGSPPGYVGHEEEGQLTSGVRANPEAVILFDEIEKADPEVTRLFLQIFDDGRLTDSHGVTADFSQTIIFLTSNLGIKDLDAGQLNALEGPERHDYLKATLDRAIRDFFSPELINRLDDILFLDFLSVEVIQRIAQKRLEEVAQRVADRGIGIQILGDAFDLIVREGYSAEFGARHLNRAIETLLLKPLAKFLLENDGVRQIRISTNDARTEIAILP